MGVSYCELTRGKRALLLALVVTEHQVEVKGCPQCGQVNQGTFPPEANRVAQYGSRLKGMMVYLMEGQLLPSNRVCEVLRDLVGVRLSEGTLYSCKNAWFNSTGALLFLPL
jgi:transposase